MSLKPSIIQIIDEGIVINYVVVEVRVKIVQVFNLDISSIRSMIFHNIILFIKIEILNRRFVYRKTEHKNTKQLCRYCIFAHRISKKGS